MFSFRVTTVHPHAMRELADLATRSQGFPSLTESVWRDAMAPGPRSFSVAAEAQGRIVAVAHVVRTGDGAAAHRELGLVLPPSPFDADVATGLLRSALDEVGEPERVVAWFPGSPTYATDAAAAVGLVPQRRLHRMERALPIDADPAWPEGVRVRTFRVGVDDAAWIAVNNRAFAGHPDQGGWNETDLRRRIEEPWFDAEGFLLAFGDGALAGFCWTKQHAEGVGEIFVIGVDPAHQGGGLGRALVVAGLHSLHDRGSSTGMLYVDAGDATAVGFYRSLGFEVVRTDTAYVWDVA